MGTLQGRVFFANGARNTDHKEYIVSTEAEVFMLPTQTEFATGYFEGDTSFDGHAQTGSICFVINKINNVSEPIIYILDKDGWVIVDKNSTGESSVVVKGKLGDNVYFSLINGTLTVYGSGSTYDFETTPAVLADYIGEITHIDVTKNVSKLGNNVFNGLTSLVDANISETVTEVSYTAFEGDSANLLFEDRGISDNYDFVINYPYGTSGEIVFENSELSTESAISLGGDVYYRNYDNNVAVIYGSGAPTGAITGQYITNNIIVCKGVTATSKAMFAHLNYQSVINEFVASEDFTLIDNNAFSGAKMNDFVVPNSVTTINDQAFIQTTMKSLVVPSSVTSIGLAAFAGNNSLKTADIQANITETPQTMFTSCTALETVVLSDSITLINVASFNGCSKLVNVDLPDNLTTISSSAFGSCNSLTTIDIPSTVTTIDTTAFNNCNNLTTINIDKAEGSVSGAPWGATNATVNWKE